MRLFGKADYKKEYTGSWNHRIGDLFKCGVEFRGRSVLDAGCNVGIIAYEIAKHEPKFIQGIDRSKDYIHVARTIFLGVTAPNRFDRIDMSRSSALKAVLLQQYDIVIFLSVYHQLLHARGAEVAARTLRLLLSRCREDFIARLRLKEFAEAEAIIIEAGFDKTFSGMTLSEDKGGESRFYAYRRRRPDNPSPSQPAL